MRRRTALAGLAGIALAPFPGVARSEEPVAYWERFQAFLRSDPQPDLSALERSVLGETNAARLAEAGAPPLAEDPRLAQVARYYAMVLAAGGRFEHQDTQGRGPGDRVGLLHRRLVGVTGENLFSANMLRIVGAAEAGPYTVKSLLLSPGHRKNMLDPQWTHGGIGAGAAGEDVVVVQLFALRAALLAEDLPLRVAPGAPLPQAARFAAGAPERIALVPPGREPGSGDFRRITAVQAPAAPGPYRLFYGVPAHRATQAGTFAIYPGPTLQVG